MQMSKDNKIMTKLKPHNVHTFERMHMNFVTHLTFIVNFHNALFITSVS